MSTRPLTVLQTLPALDGGGVERGVLEVAEALVNAGHRSLVVSAGGRMVRELTQRGSEHFTCPIGAKTPTTLRWVPWMRNLMLQQKVDVVDFHSRLPGWMTWLAWKLIPVAERPRLVSTVHGLHSVSSYSSIMCRGETVIVVSETLLNYVLQHYPKVSAGRIRLIHRGIDPGEYPRGFVPGHAWKRAFRRQFPETEGKKILTLPGRITRLKGHHDFVDLIDNLSRTDSQVHGLIVGGAHPRKAAYSDEVRQHVRSLKLDDRITFTGQRSDLKEIYATSELVLSLSRTPESFGRTVAEALSIGTPVIGYNHGGVAEILAAQFPQGAVPFGDQAALFNAVRQQLTDGNPELPGANRFEKSEMLRRTLDVYEDVCEQIPLRKAA